MPIWIGIKNEFGRKRRFDDRKKSLNFFYLKDKKFSKRPEGQGDLSFADLLINLLSLNYGLEFDHKLWSKNSELPSDWDKIMHDLIMRVGRRKIIDKRGKLVDKLIEYEVSSTPFLYHIRNSEVVNDSKDDNSEQRLQSMIIIDVNFNRVVKLKRLGID